MSYIIKEIEDYSLKRYDILKSINLYKSNNVKLDKNIKNELYKIIVDMNKWCDYLRDNIKIYIN